MTIFSTQGPEGGQEWREVRRGGDPGAGDYSLEQEVQHMIGGMDSTESQQHQAALQQQHYGSVNQHNLTTYKVRTTASKIWGMRQERSTRAAYAATDDSHLLDPAWPLLVTLGWPVWRV